MSFNVGQFINEAITITVDDNSMAGGILLPSADHIRTALKGEINCSNNAYNEIVIDSSPEIVLVDSINLQSRETFFYTDIPIGVAVNYEKATANHKCIFRLTYVDYDLSEQTQDLASITVNPTTELNELQSSQLWFQNSLNILLILAIAGWIIVKFFRFLWNFIFTRHL